MADQEGKRLLDFNNFVPEVNVSYLALTENLGRKDDPLLLKDYAKVLHLSEQQLSELTEYMVSRLHYSVYIRT